MIDDDEMMRILFRDIFWIHRTADKEYQVTPVDSLEKAREMLFGPEPLKPDIIFCDLRLPVKDQKGGMALDIQPSFDFIKELKSKEEFKKIPIVAFSSFSEQKIKEKAKEAGADHYLVKGEYMPKELIAFADTL